jgi:hypothetical protein
MTYESSQSTVHPPAHQDRVMDIEGKKKEARANMSSYHPIRRN